jgi:hypothetical protein
MNKKDAQMKIKPTHGLSSGDCSHRRIASTQRAGPNNIKPVDRTTTNTLARLKDQSIRVLIILFDSFMVFFFGTPKDSKDFHALLDAEFSFFVVIGIILAFIYRGHIMAVIWLCSPIAMMILNLYRHYYVYKNHIRKYF